MAMGTAPRDLCNWSLLQGVELWFDGDRREPRDGEWEHPKHESVIAFVLLWHQGVSLNDQASRYRALLPLSADLARLLDFENRAVVLTFHGFTF